MNGFRFSIDYNTGLPHVPEDYHWEVCPQSTDSYSSPYGVKLVRTKKFLWFSTEIVEYRRSINFTRDGHLYSSGAPLTEDNILYTCESILKDRYKHITKKEREDKLLGKYPPHKLD